MVGVTFSERYVLGEELATGGMGTVYVAMDTRLERRVALKLMKRELAADPRFVERFRREARSAGALSHPNVAGVYDYGEDQERHFIVMELVEGRDLARLLREDGPLDEDRAAHIAGQIADALGHAHSAGVVHRDVKPANVIVGPHDRVKVTDFGIARAQTDTALTATGSLLGTAQYISPEQASGTDVAPSSDLYSLGIVLFEMLTGSVPFTGDSAVAVAMRHVSDPVPRPSSLQPGVSEHMDGVVLKATAKEPRERYIDADEFATAVRGRVAASPNTSAATVPLERNAGSTAVLGAGAPATTPEGWPFPGHPPRWDPRTLGKVVLAIFAALLLIAAGLVLARLLDRTEPTKLPRREAGANNEQPAAPAEETQEPQEQVVEVPSLQGSTYDEAVAELDELGVEAERNDAPNDDYEPGVVFETTPAAGTEVSRGETVTLYVSTGPAEEEPGDEEDFVPPGQAKKDKGEEEDD